MNVKRTDERDAAIGAKLRFRRQAAEMSQQKLGKELGITFQQVQKYERGMNRLSVGRMIDAAKTLGCSVGDLLPDGVGTEGLADKDMDLRTVAAARSLLRLPPHMHDAVCRLIRDLTKGEAA